jgi:hypothetical protein
VSGPQFAAAIFDTWMPAEQLGLAWFRLAVLLGALVRALDRDIHINKLRSA